jgi:hypothetical protein
MIELEKGFKLLLNEDLEVFEGGTFEDHDLVLVNIVGELEPKFQYQALYIVSGITAQ